ncbi:hypothetical protein ACI2JA_12005 [Alkalihalobacillus sp. NPDC078783]
MFDRTNMARRDVKIVLILFTLLYSASTWVLSIDYGPALGIYVISLGAVKGYRTKELKDVFNLTKTKVLYKNIGLKDSVIEYLSLSLVFLNSILISVPNYSAFEYFWIFCLNTAVFRLIYWGVSNATKNGDFNNSPL